jgi:hypothetical protein
MDHRQVDLRSCQRCCNGGVRIAIYYDCIRFFLFENRLQFDEHFPRLPAMVSRSDAKIVVRLRNLQFAEEYF